MNHSLFGPSTPGKSSESKSHLLTLLSLALAVLAFWTRKEPLPLWIALVATGLLALGVGYIYFDVLNRKIRDWHSRWILCRSVGLLKPRLLDFLSALSHFLERDRGDSFIRLVDEINQIHPLRKRRLSVGDSSHLYTIGRFAGAVRTQVSSIKSGQNLIDAASNVYTVFSDYNSFVGQVYNKLLYAVQELSQPKADGQDNSVEDFAIREIRTKWNSFRDRQNAHIQTCLQLGEELRRHTEQVSWGSYIEHYQTLE